MAITTRWHKSSCDTPQVVVNGNVPECRACGSSAEALLQRAAEKPAPSYSGIKLPPEMPIGQMDLWWPPGVPYTRNGSPRAPPEESSGDAASLAPQASDSSLSEIYTSTLGKDRFRLLYLSGSRTLDSPIHGNLVDYGLDDCPEYETASYTWGGEDGDATPCRPAYFGDFWDVLFLTRNCWSLLQYLRPQVVTRIVWIDAICINQNSIQERGAQVSLMPEIYGNCMRVVIYPGEHIVHRGEQKFRERIRHNGAPGKRSMSPEMWNMVIESQYMRRVWIIQELILAPSAILAVENCDIYIDHNLLSPNYYSDLPDKPPSHIDPTQGREWLQYVGESWGMRNRTLYEGLRMTRLSEATDPRDRIFGIFGILALNPVYSEIVAEYSLSMRDCIIGVMGLTLLVSKAFWPLFYAQNSNKTLRYPSWVPSLDNIASETDEHSMNEAESGAIEEMLGKWTTAIGLEQLKRNQTAINIDYIKKHVNHWFMYSQLRIDWLESGRPWYQDASIDSDSGALTLRLVRLFDIPHKIMESGGSGHTHLSVEGPSAAAHFACTKKPPQLAQPCYLFLAFHASLFVEAAVTYAQQSGLPTSNTHLLLATEAEESGTFKLMHCCRLDDAALLSESPTPILPTSLLSRENSYGCSALSLFETLYETLNYEHRKHYLPSRNEPTRKDRYDFREGSLSEAMLFDMIVPGLGGTDGSQLAPCVLHLSLAAARTGDPATVTEEFRRAYAACLQFVPAEFNPVLDDEYVWFKVVDSVGLENYWDSLTRYIPSIRSSGESVESGWWPWGVIFPPWFDLQIPDIGTTHWNGWSCPIDTDCTRHGYNDVWVNRGLHYWLPCATEPAEIQMPVTAKIPLKEIVGAIRETRLCWLHRWLLAFGEKMSEDVETLLERGPRSEDSNIYLQEWPKSLREELGFVWQQEMVTFV